MIPGALSVAANWKSPNPWLMVLRGAGIGAVVFWGAARWVEMLRLDLPGDFRTKAMVVGAVACGAVAKLAS